MPKLTTRVKVIAAAALAAFIAAFLPWLHVTLGTVELDIDGWTTGAAVAAGTMLLAAAAAYLLLRRLKYRVWAPPFGDSRLAAGVAAAGLALVIYRWATPTYGGIHGGTLYGIWLAV